jgi:histidinol phosphatase-like PHP family hydrolase
MITSDWHMHTRNSCDCKHGELKTTMAETMSAIAAAGVADFGITDHLHTPVNLPDVVASRAEFDALPPDPRRHFGIEVSVMSAWELAEIATGRHGTPVYGLREGGPAGGELAIGISADELSALGVEYVVGGTHWAMYIPMQRDAVIRDYHRQNMFLACHPLVTIVAHPWWWMGHWQDSDGMYRTGPWFDDFAAIPHSMHNEFAAAAREHGKVVEANLHAILLNESYPERFRQQYADYLAGLKAAGVVLSIGSDHHAQHHYYERADLDRAVDLLAAVGLRDSDFWRLKK